MTGPVVRTQVKQKTVRWSRQVFLLPGLSGILWPQLKKNIEHRPNFVCTMSLEAPFQLEQIALGWVDQRPNSMLGSFISPV